MPFTAMLLGLLGVFLLWRATRSWRTTRARWARSARSALWRPRSAVQVRQAQRSFRYGQGRASPAPTIEMRVSSTGRPTITLDALAHFGGMQPLRRAAMGPPGRRDHR